ncbi:hypothetical protein [Duganella aceris]|uniref:Uncharacterized protein n=1 Tax=Duganella aceris TaxID=2703883 RepID=A0ABX0FPH8_9BURK|nr:hypothetical protein [Duganella aceris]NGZ86429.1 hypothetical protein [Duganella aceris]
MKSLTGIPSIPYVVNLATALYDCLIDNRQTQIPMRPYLLSKPEFGCYPIPGPIRDLPSHVNQSPSRIQSDLGVGGASGAHNDLERLARRMDVPPGNFTREVLPRQAAGLLFLFMSFPCEINFLEAISWAKKEPALQCRRNTSRSINFEEDSKHTRTGFAACLPMQTSRISHQK